MMFDVGSLLVGTAVAAAGIVSGYRGRYISHQIMPWNDLIWNGLLLSEAAVLVMSYIHPELWLGALGLVAMASFDVGYLIGYALARPPDRLNIDLPDAVYRSYPQPLVRYAHKGSFWWMPQTLHGSVQALFGVRHPIDLDLSRALNAAPVRCNNGWFGVHLPAVYPIADDQVTETTVGRICIWHRKVKNADGVVVSREPVYLLHFKQIEHTMLVSESVCDDPQNFWMRKDVWQDAVVHSAQAQARAARLEIQSETAKFDAAADLVENLIDLGADAPGAAADLQQRIEDERRRRDIAPADDEKEVSDDDPEAADEQQLVS